MIIKDDFHIEHDDPDQDCDIEHDKEEEEEEEVDDEADAGREGVAKPICMR